MSNDLLSDSVNNILDDVETTLCLPILILIVVCTLQFIIYDIINIGCFVYQTVQNLRSSNDEACVVSRVKGIIKDCARYIPGMKCQRKQSLECRREKTRREKECDLCDDYDDCDCLNKLNCKILENLEI